MSVERRDTFRVRPATREPIRVELVSAGMLEVGELVDVSEGGVGVKLDLTAGSDLVGIEFELIIKFPGNQAAYARGVVRTVRLDGGHVLGLQFVNLPDKALYAIRNYVVGRGQRHSGKMRISG
jgi:hypothetical protein